MKNIVIPLAISYLLTAGTMSGQGNIRTETFKFTFEGKTRVGVVDYPTDKPATSLVIIVPGDGQTNLNFGLLKDLRANFAKMGLACCVWDKAGCGGSEGTYDDQQTVQNSADEFIAGIEELKRSGIHGIAKIGLWGISRGGWIAPLVIKAEKSITFWISVSGVDDKDNNTYLLEANLILQGRSKDQVRTLIAEYQSGNRIFWQGGAYEDYVIATKHLYADPLYKKLHGEQYSKEEYAKDQSSAMKKFKFDNETASIVMVPRFADILRNIDCPVLAMFGERDSQVDWRRTIRYYKETIETNPKSDLTIMTFENCGHPMLKCKTCGIDYDDLKSFNYQPCDGYYESTERWLRAHNFIEPAGTPVLAHPTTR